MSSSYQARKDRAFSQRFLVLDSKTSNGIQKVKIMGTKDKEYTVTVNEDNTSTCTCIDYLIRKSPCKHCIFVVEKFLKREISDMDSLTKALEELVVTRNESCGICFEALGQFAKSSCNTCRNGLHTDCWKRWRSFSKKTSCVYCNKTFLKRNLPF